MRNPKILKPVFLLIIVLFLISCTGKGNVIAPKSSSTPTPIIITPPPENLHPITPVKGQIIVGILDIPPNSITFRGMAGLPDGTILQSQFYKWENAEKTLETWWPADQLIQVLDGKFVINVPLGQNGAPDKLLVGPSYIVEVWEKDNPSNSGGYIFDLNPPPVPGKTIIPIPVSTK